MVYIRMLLFIYVHTYVHICMYTCTCMSGSGMWKSMYSEELHNIMYIIMHTYVKPLQLHSQLLLGTYICTYTVYMYIHVYLPSQPHTT